MQCLSHTSMRKNVIEKSITATSYQWCVTLLFTNLSPSKRIDRSTSHLRIFISCRTSLSISRLGKTNNKINAQLPASITCPCQQPVAWGQAVKFSSELVDHEFVNSTNLLDDLFLEAQCYSFWARNSTDLIAPIEYEVLGKVIQGFGAVDALNSAAVAPPPVTPELPPISSSGVPSPSSDAPTAPAINILVCNCNLVFEQNVLSAATGLAQCLVWGCRPMQPSVN